MSYINFRFHSVQPARFRENAHPKLFEVPNARSVAASTPDLGLSVRLAMKVTSRYGEDLSDDEVEAKATSFLQKACILGRQPCEVPFEAFGLSFHLA